LGGGVDGFDGGVVTFTCASALDPACATVPTAAATAVASEIQRMTMRQRQGAGSQQTTAYRALIAIAEEVVANARKALDDTAAMRGKDPLTALNIKALREETAHYCALGARVIDQARRRVLDGQQVPTAEKIYSIFEPHTDLIKRGKVTVR
jgi:IS5 family transposase